MTFEDDEEIKDDEFEDEETEHEPECPFCGETEKSCEHLLLVLDRTFNGWDGGYVAGKYGQFVQPIEDRFRQALTHKNNPKFSWLEYEENDLQELWDEARQNWKRGDEYIHLEGRYADRMMIGLLEENGGIRYDTESDGVPGLSSSNVYFYAENPKKVFDDSLDLLKEFLGSAKI